MSTQDLAPQAVEHDLTAARRTLSWQEAARRTAGAVLVSSWTVRVLIAVGVLLRLGRYLQHRSLWLDESTLALNLMSRSYSHLFGRLDFDQGAPVGFLALEKLAIGALGDSERVFRLFPLLAGIASVFVFWRVAVRFLDRPAALLALAFFAVLEPFVYYSSETKQYSFDVLVALLLLWLFDRAATSGRGRDLLAFCAFGVVAPWLSHPSVFVLAGTGVALILVALSRGERRIAIGTALAAVAWIASFAVEYVTSIRHLSHVQTLAAGQASGASGSVVKDVYLLFSQPGAMPRTTIALTVFLVGVGALALMRRSWPRAVALVLMLCAGILASLDHRYPLGGRWALFLLAPAVLLLSLGGTALVRLSRGALHWAAIALVAILLAIPAAAAAKHLVRLPTFEPGTPATLQPTEQLLADLASRWRQGDTLYVSVKSQYAFRYYLTCHDCNSLRAREARLWPIRPIAGPTQTSPSFVPLDRSLIVGSPRDEVTTYVSDMEKLRGRARVWLLFTHVAQSDEATVKLFLDREGRQLAAIRDGAATLLLYDLRPQAARPRSVHG